MEIAFFWFVLSIVVAIAADSRGRHGGGWFFVSLVISPLVAALLLALMPRGGVGAVKCPECAELIAQDAKVCKHCGFRLPLVDPAQIEAEQDQHQYTKSGPKSKAWNLAFGVLFVAMLVGLFLSILPSKKTNQIEGMADSYAQPKPVDAGPYAASDVMALEAESPNPVAVVQPVDNLPTDVQRARFLMECNYQANMYATAVQAHAMGQKESTTVGYILTYLPNQTDPVPIPAKRKLWVQTMVRFIYQKPREHMRFSLASDAMHEWRIACLDNPEQFISPSMVDWAATSKRMPTIENGKIVNP